MLLSWNDIKTKALALSKRWGLASSHGCVDAIKQFGSRMTSLQTPAMHPSQALHQHRDAVCQVAARYRVANLRVFGSNLHGQDVEGSDLDLLVDPLPGTTLFDLGGLQDELHTLLGVSVEVLTPKDRPARFRDAVIQEARPL